MNVKRVWCPRDERRRCNHTDPDLCCGGGYDASCDCTCHSEPPWQPMETAPKGVLIEGLNFDGEVDLVEYRETRQCMLASVARGAGECGPGWVSANADYLPIDAPIAWRAVGKEPQA
jgi:hypothetical protein